MKKLMLIGMLTLGALGAYAGDKPQFPGGETAMKQYIASQTKYPAAAMDNGVEGIVVVGFIVKTDGSLSNLKIEKFVDPDLENEALRVVKGMPAWIPAEKNGTPVEAPSKAEVPFLLE